MARAIFVMGETGDIYIANCHRMGQFHHSSFLAGGPVAAAGEIRIETGVVKLLSRASGHYEPTSAQFTQVMDRLRDQGISASYTIDDDVR